MDPETQGSDILRELQGCRCWYLVDIISWGVCSQYIMVSLVDVGLLVQHWPLKSLESSMFHVDIGLGKVY